MPKFRTALIIVGPHGVESVFVFYNRGVIFDGLFYDFSGPAGLSGLVMFRAFGFVKKQSFEGMQLCSPVKILRLSYLTRAKMDKVASRLHGAKGQALILPIILCHKLSSMRLESNPSHLDGLGIYMGPAETITVAAEDRCGNAAELIPSRESYRTNLLEFLRGSPRSAEVSFQRDCAAQTPYERDGRAADTVAVSATDKRMAFPPPPMNYWYPHGAIPFWGKQSLLDDRCSKVSDADF